jgi:hypothetical protein
MNPTMVSIARGWIDVIAIRRAGGSTASLGRSSVGGELTLPC